MSMFQEQTNFFEQRARSREIFKEILEEMLAQREKVRDLKHL